MEKERYFTVDQVKGYGFEKLRQIATDNGNMADKP